MKKNIDLLFEGIAPEKVIYDIDNHSLVVLYPEQKEFKKGDKVRLKKNLNLEIGKWYNDVVYCKGIDDVKDAILTIDGVSESSGNIKAYNNIDGDWWMYSSEWLEHATENEVEFKRGDIVFSNDRIMIFKDMPFYYYVLYSRISNLIYTNSVYGIPFSASGLRLATPEEQRELFDALKKEGKKWNTETLQVEDIKKEFKRGDIITDGKVYAIYKERTDIKVPTFRVYVGYCNDLVLNPLNWWDYIDYYRLATLEERQVLFDVLKINGKRWNAEKLRIEDIPQRKFNLGDRVKLKDGMIDKRWESPYFVEDMHMFIGKVLTVGSYNSDGHIHLNEADGWEFAEDWLELYSDEPIIGELAIFWDNYREFSKVKIYKRRNCAGYYDHNNMQWKNAIKFISKEQFLEHIKD